MNGMVNQVYEWLTHSAGKVLLVFFGWLLSYFWVGYNAIIHLLLITLGVVEESVGKP